MLQGLGHTRVDHIANVGLVNPHAKGDRGDDHVDLLPDEGILVPIALLRAQPGVIRQGAVALPVQLRAQLLDLPAADGVDNSRAPGILIHHPADLAKEPIGTADPVDQVRPVKGADEIFRLNKTELPGDVAADLVSGGGRVGVHRDAGKDLLERAEGPVLRTEVVPPLADAMRLVDREVGQVPVGSEEGQHVFPQESLGGKVEEPKLSGPDSRPHLVALLELDRRVDKGRLDAVGPQRVDLVLHQGNERRDDHGKTAVGRGLRGNRRRLVAQRLPAAGGQHDNRVAAFGDGLHRLGLQGEKALVPPVLLHRLDKSRCYLFHTTFTHPPSCSRSL